MEWGTRRYDINVRIFKMEEEKQREISTARVRFFPDLVARAEYVTEYRPMETGLLTLAFLAVERTSDEKRKERKGKERKGKEKKRRERET